MCNTCNSSATFNGTNGCGCSTGCGCNGNSLWNWLFGNSCCNNGCGCNNGTTFSGQRICRDGCGNIWVRQRSGCGCNNCCGCNTCHCCNNGCGCNGNGTTTNNGNSANSTNGNGGWGNFACVTFCGNRGTNYTQTLSDSTFSNDSYYDRQYGLTGRSGRSGGCSCGCNG